jgi:hypothetical protein
MKGGTVAREWLTSAGAVVLAFLASQHHNLHMLLFAIGIGGAGTSFITTFPLIRRAMLLMSLLMVIVILYQVRDSKRTLPMRIMGGVSVMVTLSLVAWSILQFGF